MQQVYQATNIIEASIVKGLLEQAGLDVYLNGYYLQGGVGELPVADIASIWVDDGQLEDAKLILDDYLDHQFMLKG